MNVYGITPTATAGRFQSKNGEDFVHYLDSDGRVLWGVDGEGSAFGYDFVLVPEGISLRDVIASGGLPSMVDLGTF